MQSKRCAGSGSGEEKVLLSQDLAQFLEDQSDKPITVIRLEPTRKTVRKYPMDDEVLSDSYSRDALERYDLN